MEQFLERLKLHTEHVKNMHSHCQTEETTKQALILPLLDILGFSPYNPTQVKAEHSADFKGSKVGERVDYALFYDDQPIMLIEAKSVKEDLKNHDKQLSRYFNCSLGVSVGILTNGKEWRFFTDLEQSNIMDDRPFLSINFLTDKVDKLIALEQFIRDNFKKDSIRGFAEENLYIREFKSVINSCLKDVDADFVKFVASRSDVQKQLNARFLESITPLVKTALEQSISEIVVDSLSTPKVERVVERLQTNTVQVEPEFIVDANNEKIITTKDEMELFQHVCDILEGEELTAKDTESYYSVLYQGKNNRWVVRYNVNRKRPTIQFNTQMNDFRVNEVERVGLEMTGDAIYLDSPKEVLRLTGILKDAYEFVIDDENFKRKKSED